MKKRLHDKKAGIAILISLIIISLAEVIFRSVTMWQEFSTPNFGEQLATIALAVTILILTAKGKDRACYILYGAWIGYFVLDQIFELPGSVIELVNFISSGVPSLGGIIRVAISIFIIALGVLLVEYMSDGTIFNKLFNALSLIAVLLLLVSFGLSISALASDMSGFAPDIFTAEELKINVTLDAFNNAYRFVMIFMFTFFAYDSAKAQLKKTDLTK